MKIDGYIAVRKDGVSLGYESTEIEARRGAQTYEFNHLPEDIRIEAISHGDAFLNREIQKFDVEEHGWKIRPIKFVFIDEE